MNAQACRNALSLMFRAIAVEANFAYSDNNERYDISYGSIDSMSDAEAVKWMTTITSGDAHLSYVVKNETIIPALVN